MIETKSGSQDDEQGLGLTEWAVLDELRNVIQETGKLPDWIKPEWLAHFLNQPVTLPVMGELLRVFSAEPFTLEAEKAGVGLPAEVEPARYRLALQPAGGASAPNSRLLALSLSHANFDQALGLKLYELAIHIKDRLKLPFKQEGNYHPLFAFLVKHLDQLYDLVCFDGHPQDESRQQEVRQGQIWRGEGVKPNYDVIAQMLLKISHLAGSTPDFTQIEADKKKLSPEDEWLPSALETEFVRRFRQLFIELHLNGGDVGLITLAETVAATELEPEQLAALAQTLKRNLIALDTLLVGCLADGPVFNIGTPFSQLLRSFSPQAQSIVTERASNFGRLDLGRNFSTTSVGQELETQVLRTISSHIAEAKVRSLGAAHLLWLRYCELKHDYDEAIDKQSRIQEAKLDQLNQLKTLMFWFVNMAELKNEAQVLVSAINK